MARQQEQAPSVQPHERFVVRRLTAASDRVRSLDLTAAVLLLLIATLLYALAVGLTDLSFGLSAQVRQVLLLIYGLAVLLYAGGVLWLFWQRRVNPYYAAQQLERSLPDAKGSLINWLDLHDRPLPPAIQAALGARAARDLGRADVESAISGRRNLYLAALVAGLLVGLVALFLSGPGRFGSLLARAFVPFSERAIPTRTDIVLLEPADGNRNVAVNQKVFFRVQVTGRVPPVNRPDSVRLLYRYNRTDPYARQPLERDANDEWTTTFLPDQVQNGFWYRIAAGDAQTPEYQVRVLSVPQVVRFDLRFHYRPYLRLADRQEHYPNQRAVSPQIKDYRGTQVTLTLKTNRVLQEGGLELDQDGAVKHLKGSILPNDPEAFRVQFVLERSGTFRVRFRARDEELNSDRAAYPLEVIADRAPIVVLDKPGKDIHLPANGTLRLHGSATDDFGIKRLTLRLRVSKGEERPQLRPKIYRPGKSFRFASGRYPDRLDYDDFVALDQVKTAAGAAFPLAAGMELEYWLEAQDNCDYPNAGGNVGRSKKYKIIIGEPDKDVEKQQQERKQAEQEQKAQQKKQDQDLAQQEQKAGQQERQQQQAQSQQDPAHQKQREQQRKEFEKKAQDVAKALGQQEQQQGQEKKEEQASTKGSSRGQGPSPPQAGQRGAKQSPPSSQRTASQSKSQGQPKGREPGQAKAGQQGKEQTGNTNKAAHQPPQRAQAGDAKDAGKQMTQAAQAKGDGKGKADQAGQAKAAAKQGGKEQAGAQANATAKKGSPQAGAEQAQTKEGFRPQSVQTKHSEGPAQAKGQQQPQRSDRVQTSAPPGQTNEPPGLSRRKDRRDKLGGSPEKGSPQTASKQQGPGQAKADKGQEQSARGQTKSEGHQQTGQTPPGQAREQTEGQKQQDTAKGQGRSGKDDTAPKAQAKEGRWRQGTLGGSGGPENDARGSVADAEAARRAGELHLEELKKKLTPDVLKKLHWTEKDRDEFLKQAREYQQWLQQHSKEKLSGGRSILPSSGARPVGPAANPAQDSLDSLHILPPPEFRDALRRFSSSPEDRPGP
jgi:collagen type III alpha